MFRLLWAASIHTRNFLGRYMPTNILLHTVRTRRGLKWGVPAMLLAVPYLIAASTCSAWVAGGGPGWANVLVLLFGWNALKFIVMGPISIVLIALARVIDRTLSAQERNASSSASSFASRR